MLPEVTLQQVSRDDVVRLDQWLRDEEVSASWYGTDAAGEPIHVGYSPERVLEGTTQQWDQAFSDDERKISSIYATEEGHIGEGQVVLEQEVRSAHIFILIGRKDLWHHHYGSAAMVKLLDAAFYTYNMHRAWVAVPEYNLPALRMCEHIGFVLEGRLRRRQLRGGQWYDSLSMGLLADEYSRRRARLLTEEAMAT